MNQKRISLIAILAFVAADVIACCVGSFVHVYPRAEQLAQNPVILINFAESDFKAYDYLPKLTFYLENDKGLRIPLDLIDQNKGAAVTAQVLLKATKDLRLGEQVHLKVKAKRRYRKKIINWKMFKKQVESNTWNVQIPRDETPSKWTSKLSSETYNYMQTSAPTHGVKIAFSIFDEYAEKYRFGSNNRSVDEHLFKLTINDKSFYSVSYQNSVGVYNGLCSANFDIELDQTYPLQIEAVDFSGNRTQEIKEIIIATASKAEKKFRIKLK